MPDRPVLLPASLLAPLIALTITWPTQALADGLQFEPFSIEAPSSVQRTIMQRGVDATASGVDAASDVGVLFSDDFEGAFPGTWLIFQQSGPSAPDMEWGVTDFRSDSPDNSAWQSAGGGEAAGPGGMYANDMQVWLYAGPFDMTDSTGGSLDFRAWLDMPEDDDQLAFLVSTDGQSFNGQAVGGSSDGWTDISLDLLSVPTVDPIGAPEVWIAIIFISDGSGTAEGTYVDDVVLETFSEETTADVTLRVIDAEDGTYSAGSLLRVYTETENIGDEDSDTHSISYFASTDEDITTDDRFIGTLTDQDPLTPGEIRELQVSGNLPDDIPDGEYFIGAIVNVNDANPDNNVNYDPMPITVSNEPEISVDPLELSIEGGADETQDVPDAQLERDAAMLAGILTAQNVDRLAQKARDRGQVRIIVGLDTEFSPEALLPGEGRSAQRDRIRGLQESLIGQVDAGAVRNLKRFRTIPYMAMTVNEEALRFLAASPVVTSITEDSLSRVQLESSNQVIGSPVAWAEGADGSGQAVVVLDTGADINHPWFAGKIVSEACYSTNSATSESMCPGGVERSTAAGSGDACEASIPGCDHGTHVAGIAVGNDGNGPEYGVARGADLIPMQVFSRFTDEEDCGSDPTPCERSFGSDQVLALERALELSQTIDIASVNMSLGGGEFSDVATCDAQNVARKAAIDNLRAAGIATVVSSGNDGYRDSMGQPACISTAVSVGSTTDNDFVSIFSNVADFLDLMAPGTNINSAVPGGGTGVKQGTSMAAPHVAGAWAIMKQVEPGGTVDGILQKLRDTGTSVDDQRNDATVVDMRRINIDLAFSDTRRSFSIRNRGGGTLNVTDIAPNTNAPWLSWSPTAPFDVEPGSIQVVTVDVDFDQAPMGKSTRRLLIESNDATNSPFPGGVFVSVTNGGGGGEPPMFSSMPDTGSSLAFGDQPVDNLSSPMDITVTNDGGSEMTLDCSVSGNNAGNYSISLCPSHIAAGESDVIRMRCRPISNGQKPATLNVMTNDPENEDVSYELRCRGVDNGGVVVRDQDVEQLTERITDLIDG